MRGEYSKFEWVTYQIEEGSLPKDLTELKNFVRGKQYIRTIRDVSIAASFLVLRATELGLGTCFVGWVNEGVLKETLKIPEKYITPFVICVGYPDEHPTLRPRRKLNEIILK